MAVMRSPPWTYMILWRRYCKCQCRCKPELFLKHIKEILRTWFQYLDDIPWPGLLKRGWLLPIVGRWKKLWRGAPTTTSVVWWSSFDRCDMTRMTSGTPLLLHVANPLRDYLKVRSFECFEFTMTLLPEASKLLLSQLSKSVGAWCLQILFPISWNYIWNWNWFIDGVTIPHPASIQYC